MTRNLLAISAVLLMAGCGRNSERADAINALLKACETPATITVQVGGWDEHVSVSCQVKPGSTAGGAPK